LIIISGATGTIGGELLDLLSNAGASIRALSRNPPGDESSPGFEWARADLGDRRSLGPAFDGGERLFLLTGNVENMVRAQKQAIDAAIDAGIRHIVKVSALGASDHSNSVIGMWHWVVEQALRGANVEWTILRPHVFMQNLLDQRRFIRDEGRIYSPSGDAAIPMIDTRDIAACAAAALTSDGHHEKRYTLSGPEPVSYADAAAILSDVLGKPVEYVRESEDDAWHRMHAAGQPPWLIGAQLALADYQRKGGGTDVVTDAVERLTGRPARSFRNFVEDHAQSF
jgi:uncharacterized protein YbjT (DUF2867 family)